MKNLFILSAVLTVVMVTPAMAGGMYDKKTSILEEMDLSKEQKKAIKEIRKDYRAQLKAVKKDHKAKSKEEGACQVCVGKKADEGYMKLKTAMQEEIAGVLNEEQRDTYIAHLTAMKEMHEAVMAVKAKYKEEMSTLKESHDKAEADDAKAAIKEDMMKLKTAMAVEIADIRGLEGKDREKFIKRATSYKERKDQPVCIHEKK